VRIIRVKHQGEGDDEEEKGSVIPTYQHPPIQLLFQKVSASSVLQHEMVASKSFRGKI